MTDLNALRDDTDVIWGAEAIGRQIGLSKRKVFHLLETNQLRGAVKVGSRWCITRRNLRANFEARDALDTALQTLLDQLSPEEREAFFGEDVP